MQAIRFAHLAKEVTFKGQFCIFRFAQHLQNHFKCSLSHYLQINLCTLAMLAHKLGPSLGFFGRPNFVLLRCFTAGCMPLYLFFGSFPAYFSLYHCVGDNKLLSVQSLLCFSYLLTQKIDRIVTHEPS